MIKEKKEAHKSAQKRFTHFHSSAVLASSSTLRRSNSSAQTFRSPLKPSFHPPPTPHASTDNSKNSSSPTKLHNVLHVSYKKEEASKRLQPLFSF